MAPPLPRQQRPGCKKAPHSLAARVVSEDMGGLSSLLGGNSFPLPLPQVVSGSLMGSGSSPLSSSNKASPSCCGVTEHQQGAPPLIQGGVS